MATTMKTIQQPEFSPYTDNGGTVVGISGKNYVILASETRLSNGYTIRTRLQPKTFQLGPKLLMGATGCWCDATTFAKVIEARAKNYLYEHNRAISTPACAQLISNMLYYKRFFPYYITPLLAGLDENGRGLLYSYDPVGSYDQHHYHAVGSSSALIQPFLDNRIGLKNIRGFCPEPADMPLEDALKLIKDVFVSAGERDIYVGDFVDVKVITSEGIQSYTYALRKD